MITVAEIMTPRWDLIVMSPDDNLADASHIMTERRVRHLPVLDGEGRLLGIVSHRDLLAAAAPRRPGAPTESASIRLSEIMSSKLHTVAPECGVRQAALHLRSLGVGCLPVVDDDGLAGIVTDSDFVAVAINLIEQLEEIEPVSSD